MAPSDVDYALQTLISKIKERDLESQRSLDEQEVSNRLLRLQVQDLQNKLNEKETQLTDANETIRALRSVTQVIAGLQDEIRALRTQLCTSLAHSHPPITTPNKTPAVASTPLRTQASDDLSHCTSVNPTGSDYISQNSTQDCPLLTVISDCGRTTEVAVPNFKHENSEVEMAGEEGNSEEQDPDESVKKENSREWDGDFEYNHAALRLNSDFGEPSQQPEPHVQFTIAEVVSLASAGSQSVEEVEPLPKTKDLRTLKQKSDFSEPSQHPELCLQSTIAEVVSLASVGSDSEEEVEPLPKRKRKDLRNACELTLDPNTAHTHLSLSEGNRKVTCVSESQSYSDQPERFNSWPQVLCREALSGRCYWEAEWSGAVCIAVAYKSIQRKGAGDDNVFGWNAKSWSLECSSNGYSAWHNDKETTIAVPSSSSSRVGVYLDWPAGSLSFYSISSDTRTHLHTFHSTFDEPLYPGFYVFYNSSVSLSQVT